MELVDKLYYFNKLPFEKMVVCLGEFDGLHIGHLELFKKALECAKENNLLTGVITFYPHPDYVLNLRSGNTYITPLNDKKEILESLGIDYLIVIDFTKELASLDYVKFYNEYLSKFNTLVVGFDFSFGYKGLGKVKDLCLLHKKVIVTESVNYNNTKVCSNLIRNLLLNGKIEEANILLSRPYFVKGIVVNGNKIGRTMGLPTANIQINNEYQLFKEGVYAVKITIENVKYLGIANFGTNPSFNEVKTPRLEVFIFNFDNNIYSKEVKVELLEFIRDEIKFENKKEFKEELNKNIKYVKEKYGVKQ